jgi:uncharacterized membrane protein
VQRVIHDDTVCNVGVADAQEGTMAQLTDSPAEPWAGRPPPTEIGRDRRSAGDRLAWQVLWVLMTSYAIVFTAMALARLDTFRQGFDLVSYVQPIWNTSQGRPFEQSVYAGTRTILGVDLFLIEGLLALPYALAPSYATLFIILASVTALGGLAIFLMAREQPLSGLAALLAAGLYLANFTIQSVTPYEFRPRLIAATALLFAFYFQQRGQTLAFWLAAVLALSVRLDVALSVAMLGLVGLVMRRPWPVSLAPMVVASLYWLVGMLAIVPALRHGESFLFLFYFAWLGDSPSAIVTTLITRPGYVLSGIVTAEKLRYVLQLLWPVGGLALLRPVLLLPALPSLAINLLAGDRTLLRLDYDYSVLIIPWLVVAAVYAVGDLAHGRGWLGSRLRRWTSAPMHRTVLSSSLLGLLLLATLSQQMALGSPVAQFLRGYRPPDRAAAARQVLATVPAGPVAVTSELAPHLAQRRQIYFFPGNRAYSASLIDNARWVVADRRRTPAERVAVERLIASGNWRRVLDVEDYVLLERLR